MLREAASREPLRRLCSIFEKKRPHECNDSLRQVLVGPVPELMRVFQGKGSSCPINNEIS